MVRVLGEPEASSIERYPASGETWYKYPANGKLSGKLVVVVDTRTERIFRLDLYPTSLTRSAAIEHFGRGYITTRYDFDECLSDGESAPLYESPNGTLEYVEYRAMGIAIYADGPEVREVSYVSEPVGTRSSRCKDYPVPWSAATFQGLQVGNSTRDDAIRILGQPHESHTFRDLGGDSVEALVWSEYLDQQGIAGRLSVRVNVATNKVLQVELYPMNLSKTQAGKLFGNDFHLSREGGLDCLQYRNRGIVLVVDAADSVQRISFVSGDDKYSLCKVRW